MADPVASVMNAKGADGDGAVPFSGCICCFASCFTVWPDCIGCKGSSDCLCYHSESIACKLPKEEDKAKDIWCICSRGEAVLSPVKNICAVSKFEFPSRKRSESLTITIFIDHYPMLLLRLPCYSSTNWRNPLHVHCLLLHLLLQVQGRHEVHATIVWIGSCRCCYVNCCSILPFPSVSEYIAQLYEVE